jgi:hypothetical protein
LRVEADGAQTLAVMIEREAYHSSGVRREVRDVFIFACAGLPEGDAAFFVF